MFAKLYHALARRKTFEPNEPESKLNRVLTLVDLTALGVGSTLGLGVYVLAGAVAYENAGPAVTISFVVAATASALAGMCYAEFGTRVPQAGSAYVYSYVTVGEFVAFNIGWNLILEYVIGTSSVSRGLSNYIDTLLGGRMSKSFREAMPMNVAFMGKYPDFFALGGVSMLTFLLAIGVKESSFVNNVLTALNLATIFIVVIVGSCYSDSKNWFIKKENIPIEAKKPGEGGFMPFGFSGVMVGAAKCFFGFVGFDLIATTGEEAIDPKKNIPRGILITLITIFVAYFSIATVLTMMIPYYDQNPDAPFPHAFQKLKLYTVKWIVTVGAVIALCASSLDSMFPLPRIIYAMSDDGVIFRPFRIVNKCTKTPVYATLLSGVLAGSMALLFDLNQLIDMMSIGTLLAYTIVAVCVLILRYEIDQLDSNYQIIGPLPKSGERHNLSNLFKHFVNYNRQYRDSTIFTSRITKVAIVIFCVLTSIVCLLMNLLDFNELYSKIAISVVVICMSLTIYIIWRQPASKRELVYSVPLIPFVPCLSIFSNTYLMFQLDTNTWIRFIIWLILGFLIYFLYGIKHSVQGIKEAELEKASLQPSPQKAGKKK